MREEVASARLGLRGISVFRTNDKHAHTKR
jgi:hypothetical protein